MARALRAAPPTKSAIRWGSETHSPIYFDVALRTVQPVAVHLFGFVHACQFFRTVDTDRRGTGASPDNSCPSSVFAVAHVRGTFQLHNFLMFTKVFPCLVKRVGWTNNHKESDKVGVLNT